MTFSLLRRTPESNAAPVTVLILAASPEAAIDMGMRIRGLGYVAIEPRLDENGHEAIARLRPSVVMAQVGREELRCRGLGIAVRAVPAQFIVFGKEWPDVVDVARSHAALSLPIDAPAKMIRSAIQLACSPAAQLATTQGS
jgi:hypothetical protein